MDKALHQYILYSVIMVRFMAGHINKKILKLHLKQQVLQTLNHMKFPLVLSMNKEEITIGDQAQQACGL